MRALRPDEIERYRRKAVAVGAAWSSVFGGWPSLRATARVLAVAEHESHLGDGAGHNWGAVHKRGLTAVERATLTAHGLFATGRDVALRAARALLPAAPNEILAIDTSPTAGPYFSWFWAFANDTDAAAQFLRTLLVHRPLVRAVLDEPSPEPFARAMFVTHYYEGFHANDPEANVRDYARRLAELEPTITGALLHGAPGGTSAPLPVDVAAPPPVDVAAPPPPVIATETRARSSGTADAVLAGLGLLLTAISLGRLRR